MAEQRPTEINSILKSTKKKCGMDPDTMTEFDADMIDAINAALNVLTQVGVGPENGFVIHGDEEEWKDFIGDDVTLTMARTYVFDRCTLMFDAASKTSYVIQMIQDRIKEFEWRMNVQVETPGVFSNKNSK